MPSLSTFLDIEDSMREATLTTWESQAKSVSKKLQKAVDKLDERIIGDAFDKLDFSKFVKKSESKVYSLMVSSLIYGASFAANKKSDIIYKKDNIDLPDQLEAVLEVYKKIHTIAAPEVIKRRAAKIASQAIADEKDKKIQKADQLVVDALNAAVLGTGQMMTDIAANLTTSRLVSYGFLAQAKAQGIEKYQLQATLDKRTSKICRRLHGRVFNVDVAYAHLNEVLKVTNPEELKVMAPFVKGDKATLHDLEKLSNDELAAKGVMVPPFHPGCRTVLVKVGQVNTSLLTFTPVVFDVPPPKPEFENEKVLSTAKLNAIQDAIQQSVENGMDEWDAAMLHDPHNYLGLH